jgi:hypothetical protein
MGIAHSRFGSTLTAARGFLWSICCCGLAAVALAQTPPPEVPVLARVELAGPPASYNLPVHVCLQDVAGRDYLLVFATESLLNQAGWPWKELSRNVTPEECVLATEMRAGARVAGREQWRPLYDDGRLWLLRATPDEAEQLAEAGFALQRLSAEPLVWSKPPARRPKDGGPPTAMPDPLVAAMVRTVDTTNLYSLLARLCGREPVLAGGGPQLISTRNTTSRQPLTNALEVCFNRLQALGLNPVYSAWTNGGYTNRNLVATLPGTTRSNELVLLTAHLDDMPTGTNAPGADDNASGSVAVLTAAGVFSQCQFQRTLRFVLFTGEEQGLYGSARYAAAAQTAGDNLVGVLNLDMIAWDGSGPATFQLHIRTSVNPGYSNDLVIASAFTNAVAAYGLALAPALKPDGMGQSDHASFWNRGYAAVCGIEDYGGDFNPHYHTTNDNLAHVNLCYFTASVKAAVATAAHLAGPVARVPADVLEVVSSDWTPGGTNGANPFLARHLPAATETGADPFDLALSNAPANPNSRCFELDTTPDGPGLLTDSRPSGSESPFVAALTMAAPDGVLVSTGDQLRFDFLSPPQPERLYLARIRVPGQFTPDGTDFLCVTNLRQVAAAGGYLPLPGLLSMAATNYGTCEIACHFLDTTSAGCPLQAISLTPSNFVFVSRAQAGVKLVDDLECISLLSNNTWTRLTSFTNDVAVDNASFDSGWQDLPRVADLSTVPPAPQYFFRLKRTWLAP